MRSCLHAGGLLAVALASTVGVCGDWGVFDATFFIHYGCPYNYIGFHDNGWGLEAFPNSYTSRLLSYVLYPLPKFLSRVLYSIAFIKEPVFFF